MATKTEQAESKPNDVLDEPKRDEPHEGKYKLFGCFQTDCLQCCNNPIGFLVVLFIFILGATMVSGGLLNLNVTPLEKRFGLTSTQSSLIVVGYDIGFFVMTLFISYYGMNASRPKMVAVGATVFGLGCLLYSLPHFVTENYSFGATGLQVTCPVPGATALPCLQSEDLTRYLGLLLTGSILMGCGVTPFFTVGFSYLEDSVSKHAAPVYLGICNAGALIGPIIGFVAGGRLFLDQFVDFDRGVKPGMTFVDARWIGAWWVGTLIAMAIACTTAVPIFGFPKQLPGTNKVRAARISETHSDGGVMMAEAPGFGGSVRDFPKAFWIIIRNPVFVCITASACCQSIVVNGVSAFMAKFLENEFLLATGRAAELTGAVLAPAGAVGHILAGVLINRMKWNTSSILKFNIMCLIIVIGLSPITFLHCNSKVAGINQEYSFQVPLPNNSFTQVTQPLMGTNLTAGCNAHCSCQEEFYIPVCGADGVTYFSPCSAGCFGANFTNPGDLIPFEYTFCRCVSGSVKKAYQGPCNNNCTTTAAFLAVMFFVVFFSFATLTPSLVMTFRVVPEKVRTFAVGLQWLFVRGVGAVPGPLIYGALIDLACVLWQTRQCNGTRGSCWIYDNRHIAIIFACLSMSFNFAAVLFYAIGLAVYKPVHDFSEAGGLKMEKYKLNISVVEGSVSENRAYENENDLK